MTEHDDRSETLELAIICLQCCLSCISDYCKQIGKPDANPTDVVIEALKILNIKKAAE